jgi:hypothetical protein
MASAEPPNFRERARVALDREEFDGAIRLFLAALRQSPGDVSIHRELREASLLRKASGGKSLGLIEKMRIQLARNPQRRLVEAAKVLAYDPGSMDAMADVVTSANEAGYGDVAKWMWRILERAQSGVRRH